MSFQSFMERVLPRKFGKPHISGSTFNSHRNRPRTNNKHAAVDFNYQGGQKFNKSAHFNAYAPVDGIVVDPYSGEYGCVTIRDSKGYTHGILHLVDIGVRKNQKVTTGDKIGVMAGKGKRGRYHYDVHIHYQLRNPAGELIDPVSYWDGNKQVFITPSDENYEEPHRAGDPGYSSVTEPSDPVGNIEEYMPRQAGVSTKASVGMALWTNRVPEHEPWPRTMMVNTPGLNGPTDEIEYNTNHVPQLDDNTDAGAKLIGRLEGEEEIPRGKFWRR